MSSATERPYCTCNKGTRNKPMSSVQYETDVDKHGYCIYCSHVVIWRPSKYELYPRGDSVGGYRPVSACKAWWNHHGLTMELFAAFYKNEDLSRYMFNDKLFQRTRKCRGAK